MDSKFPYAMIIEILWRTSLKSLDTMRCTSQEVLNLTYESYFLNQYNQRNSDMVSGFLLQNLRNGCDYTNEFAPSCESKSLDLGFLPPNARILASTEQGLMVFESPHPRDYRLVSYHVCKPATKQVLRLPNPKTKYQTENVAMVVVGSKPLHYKIIRLSEPKPEKRYKQYTMYRYEMFDSRASAWRLLDPVILPSPVFLINQQPITTRGSIYMPLSNNEVLKFDGYSEKWTTISSPIQTLDYTTLVKYNGKLGFTRETQSRLWEIWVLTLDESWEKLNVLDTREDFGRSSLEAIYHSDTKVMSDYNTLHSYRIFNFRSEYEPAQF